MDTKERIKEFLALKKIGQNRFAKDCGFSDSLINNVKGSIGSDKLNKISSRYPELSMDWLITGKGEMLKGEPPEMGVANYVGENARLHRENEELSKKVIALMEELRELERKPTAEGASSALAGKRV